MASRRVFLLSKVIEFRFPQLQCFLNRKWKPVLVMKKPIQQFILLCAAAVPGIAMGKNLEIQVVTAIEAPDCQPGVKSTQLINVDTESLDVDSSYTTGKTSIFGCELSSVNDSFTIEGQMQTETGFSFTAVGRTATALSLGMGPHIDYRLKFTFDKASQTLTVSGKHDGYPTYYVKINGSELYRFDQRNLIDLTGELEINVEPKTVSYK